LPTVAADKIVQLLSSFYKYRFLAAAISRHDQSDFKKTERREGGRPVFGALAKIYIDIFILA
jgi:hypothetical protein